MLKAISFYLFCLAPVIVQVSRCHTASGAPSLGHVPTPSATEGYNDSNDYSNGCLPSPSSPATKISVTRNIFVDLNTLFCRVGRLVRNLLHQLSATQRPIVLMRGFEIVPANDKGIIVGGNVEGDTIDKDAPNRGSLRDTSSLLGRFRDYLRKHELNIKFSELLMYLEMEDRSESREMNSKDVNVAEGRHKKKHMGGHKGGHLADHHGAMLLVSMMFSKMMAMMTLGGIGALAMKALGVAMAALMMSGMHGMKMMLDHNKNKEEKEAESLIHRKGRSLTHVEVLRSITASSMPMGALTKTKDTSGSNRFV